MKSGLKSMDIQTGETRRLRSFKTNQIIPRASALSPSLFFLYMLSMRPT